MHLTQLLMINQSRLIKVVAGVLSLLCVVGCDFAKMKKCPSYVTTYIDIQGLKLKSTSDKMSVEVALRARSRHEKIISLHVVFESRHT